MGIVFNIIFDYTNYMTRTIPLLDSQKEIERLRRLVELSVSLNSTLNLNELLNTIIKTAADILGCEAGSILLVNEKTGNLFFAASSGSETKKLAEIPVPMNNSLAGTIFQSGEPIIINVVDNEPRHNQAADKHSGFATESLLGVPLKIRERKMGVLEVLNKKNGIFTQEDAAILKVVASHAAVALHNGQLVQALKQAYDDVRNADELKSNFLTLASHELRTPLGIIIGYATFLREEAAGELSDHAEQVLNAAQKMRAILEDMNNLTMLEKDTSTILPHKTHIQKLLSAMVAEVAELAKTRGQEIVLDLPNEAIYCFLDEKKLNTAISNLLHNALRFSPENETVTLGAKLDGENLLCWVKDQGIGLSTDQLERIFEKFYQVDSPNVRRYGGMGLGLTIAKGLIEAQGGKIWAESAGKGKGATFTMSLPYRKMPAA